MAEDSSFLRRWSRRKTLASVDRKRRHGGASPVIAEEAAAPVPAEIIETPATSAEQDGTAPPAEATEDRPETVDLESLPDIDTLDKSSDYSVFMQDGVPDDLRNKALSRLWQLDPMFNEVDGMVEYGEDFSIARKIAKSLYRVGKGMLTDDEHAALDRESTYVPPAADDDAAPDDAAPDDATTGAAPEAEVQAEPSPIADGTPDGPDNRGEAAEDDGKPDTEKS